MSVCESCAGSGVHQGANGPVTDDPELDPCPACNGDGVRAETSPLEPVLIELERHHPFKQRRHPETGAKLPGCGECRRARTDILHAGAPPSLNVFSSSGHFTYRTHKHEWQRELLRLLRASPLKPCQRVMVEATATFPDRARRDQGNYRFILEKALGDALTEGGYLEDDDWTRYSFGNLGYAYERGVSRTSLILFPG